MRAATTHINLPLECPESQRLAHARRAPHPGSETPRWDSGQPFPSDAARSSPYLQSEEEEEPLPAPRPAPPAQRPCRRPRGSASRRTARVACTPDQGRPPASLATAAQPHRPPPVGRSDPEGVARSRRRRAAPPLGSSQEVRRHGDGARAGRTSAAPAQPRTVLGDRDRGSQHPTALTASPSRARDASTRLPPSASQPPRRGRRPTANCESTGRLARARGGASGRPGLWETSASGTAAIATLDSAGPRNWTRQQKLTPGPSIPESRLPSLCRPPSEPDMLEHLSSLPTQMDYKGQKLAEQMFQGIILFSAIVGFIYGYLAEQFGWTVYIVMAGFAFSCLLTLPPWPIYRRHPLKWLPVQDSSTEDKKPGERKVKRHAKNN